MAESDGDQSPPRFSNLLRDLSIELKSKSVEEMRLMLSAFDRVDGVLASLQEEHGTQVYRGVDVVAEYERSRQERGEPVAHNALDYIVRKESIELQLQVKLAPAEGLSITGQDAEEYYRVLRANPKTEEIILVWATEELHSLALGPHEVQTLLLEKGETTEVAKSQLKPLRDTIVAAIDRHRRTLREPEALAERRKVEFDLAAAFCKALQGKLDDLRDSAERRRAPDRRAAIRSITESDRRQIEVLFARSQTEELMIDELKEQIEAICQSVGLD